MIRIMARGSINCEWGAVRASRDVHLIVRDWKRFLQKIIDKCSIQFNVNWIVSPIIRPCMREARGREIYKISMKKHMIEVQKFRRDRITS